MLSKASIKSHPLHPMLVGFPIAFFVAAPIFDIIGITTQEYFWWRSAAVLNIAGVIAALVAAAPGMIDYLTIVPPRSSAKKRATYHMIVNVTATVLFLVAWFLRPSPELGPPGTGIVALQLAGIVLVTMGGWMGATLVYRNQIGVDHRYADAGKWDEIHAGTVNGIIDLGKIPDMRINQMKLVVSEGRRFVLAKTEEGFTAFDDRCTHKGGPLSDGVLTCGTVSCPWHGSQFDVASGEVSAGPAKKSISVYRVIEENGRLILFVTSEGEEKWLGSGRPFHAHDAPRPAAY
ncbi:MAG: Rieske 2Fe-2S domain-containing protein [Deltaproteobacteria bacterium]|nr:Rieske 2Fe-2S domain-containing protein [Deltaproteobacteria bacterium]